jgi:hypothetical protein
MKNVQVLERREGNDVSRGIGGKRACVRMCSKRSTRPDLRNRYCMKQASKLLPHAKVRILSQLETPLGSSCERIRTSARGRHSLAVCTQHPDEDRNI